MKMLCCEHHVITQFLDLLMEPLWVKPVTMQLVHHLIFQQPCQAEVAAAFGLSTPAHQKALSGLLHAGLFDGDLLEIIQQLDAAAYQDTALSDLIAQHAPDSNYLAFEPRAAEPEDSSEALPF